MSLGLAHGNVHADQTVGGPRANTRRRRPAALHTNKNMQEEVGTSCTPQRGCARRAWPYLQPDSSAGCTLEFPVSGIHLRFVFLCAPSSEAGINNMACEAHWKAPADQTVGGPGARKFKSPGGGGSPPSTQNKDTHQESGSQRRLYFLARRHNLGRDGARRSIYSFAIRIFCDLERLGR